MFKRKTTTKSPLKAKPLRLPGQSLDEELSDYLYDKILAPYLLAAFFWIVTGMEWFQHLTGAPPHPWLYTFISICLTVYAAAVIYTRSRRVKQMKLGREGERAVGQFLERLLADGYRVFHDVVTGDCNIDHVLVGPNGVFTIETKVLSKPNRGNAVIRLTEDYVEANGRRLERNPVPQAKAQANWLKNFLGEAGFKVLVQPVVAFPGWYVERRDATSLGVWVLEPKAIPAFVDKCPQRLTDEQISAISSALMSYIRTYEKA